MVRQQKRLDNRFVTLLADASMDRGLFRSVLHHGINHVSQSDGVSSSTARESPSNIISDDSCGDHGASIPKLSELRHRSFHQHTLPLAPNSHLDPSSKCVCLWEGWQYNCLL
jgi:hypothetical protein